MIGLDLENKKGSGSSASNIVGVVLLVILTCCILVGFSVYRNQLTKFRFKRLKDSDLILELDPLT